MVNPTTCSVAAAALALFVLAAPVSAQATPLPSAATQPANAAEPAGGALVDALNRAPEGLEAYVADHFSSGALKTEPASVRAAELSALVKAAGGFDLLQAAPQGDRMAELVAKSRRGDRFARFVVFTSGREPGKISNLFILRTRDPAKAAADALPGVAVSRAELIRALERRAANLAREDWFSGVVLVAEGNRVLLRRAYGQANLEWGALNRTDTLFQAGSTTKMLTAAAVLKLARQGRLSLDDTLARHVPEFPDRVAAERITLRHLLTHRAGLAEWDGRRSQFRTHAEAAALMPPAVAEAGKRFSYSNAGFILLGAVIERVSGQSFEKALRSLVLEPAGMRRTGAQPVTAVLPNRATGYLRPADDPLGFGPRFSNHQFLGHKGDGSGGLYTTADDLLAFHLALTSGRLLSPDLTQVMLQAHTDFPGTPRPSKYGYGVRLTECAGQAVFGHSGGGPNSGVSTATYGAPDGSWTVIVLSNYDPPAAEDFALEVCEAMGRSASAAPATARP
jgi:CubicO group peptidase (beta-lactamase class C family)